jgi:cytoskeletal protein CcmA (bactofilin family)
MNATGEVEISSTGKFVGNLTQKEALLTISKGGLFKGESIISSGTSAPKAPGVLKKAGEDNNKSPDKPI